MKALALCGGAGTRLRPITHTSIVPRRASIVGMRRIEVSLTGHNVEVTPAPRTPSVHRLVLGEHRKVRMPS